MVIIMSLKSDFFSSWKNVESQIKLDIEKNIQLYGEIKSSEILRSYNSFVKRWETDIFYEGEWLDSIGNSEFKSEFLQSLNDINFDVSVEAEKSSYTGAIIAAVGFAALWVIKFAFSAPWALSIIIALVIMAIGAVLQINSCKSSREDYNRRVKSEIIKILENKKNEIGELCDKYDGQPD